MNIICKIFNHSPININWDKHIAECKRCNKMLKVDLYASGKVDVIGDYGKQSMFLWCECGNELISSGSYHYHTTSTTITNSFETYYCAKCNKASYWDLTPPIPMQVKGLGNIQNN